MSIDIEIDYRQLTGKLRHLGYKLYSVTENPHIKTTIYKNAVYPYAKLFAPEDTGAFVESPIKPGAYFDKGRWSDGYIDETGIYFSSYEFSNTGKYKFYNQYKKSGIPDWESTHAQWEVNAHLNEIAQKAIPYIVKELNNG